MSDAGVDPQSQASVGNKTWPAKHTLALCFADLYTYRVNYSWTTNRYRKPVKCTTECSCQKRGEVRLLHHASVSTQTQLHAYTSDRYGRYTVSARGLHSFDRLLDRDCAYNGVTE